MKKTFYITTAIDYPTAKPHMGHAYEKICADVIARWHRKKGKDVFFLTGTDEHGQKIEGYASKAKKSPQQFVDEMSEQFKLLCKKLNISNNDFIRTTQPRHIKTVQDIFRKVYKNGDIYKDTYKGLYCTECEAFYLQKDLKDGRCPVHEKVPLFLEEESYFFKLSKYQDKILKIVQENEGFIQPSVRRNEIINRIKEGVRDLSVSRTSFNWGVPVPMDKGHVIFVWIDALTNYISGLGFPQKNFKKYWPADIHLIGKDILWFHAVVWPSILLAAGIELPRKILVHGFINVGGEKMSKSKGAVIDPIFLAEKYGADALRYFLMREVPFGEDGNFSEDALIRRINSDLANDLGNLVHRVSTMAEKYFKENLPENKSANPHYARFICKLKIDKLTEETDSCMQEFRFNDVLDKIWTVVNAANKSIEETKPWILAKENRIKELQGFILALVEGIKVISDNISYFMPKTAESILKQITSKPIRKGKPLFPRIELK